VVSALPVFNCSVVSHAQLLTVFSCSVVSHAQLRSSLKLALALSGSEPEPATAFGVGIRFRFGCARSKIGSQRLSCQVARPGPRSGRSD